MLSNCVFFILQNFRKNRCRQFVDLHNNHQYSSHQSRYESQVVQHQFSPTHRQSPKIVTVQSPTFSLNTRSAEASPRSTGSTDLRSAIMLRSPLKEESEREYMKMRKSSQPKEDKESDSGTSFGSFGFGGKFGFSSRDDNQDDDNNRFGGFSGSGGGFGFSFWKIIYHSNHRWYQNLIISPFSYLKLVLIVFIIISP